MTGHIPFPCRGIGHMDAFGISHTDAVGDYLIGPFTGEAPSGGLVGEVPIPVRVCVSTRRV